jgi:hypothetical protein
MAEMTQEEKDKAAFEATDIKGQFPEPTAQKAEREKFDKKGNLIDEAGIEYQKRQRDILLGKIKPTVDDYEDPNFAKAQLDRESGLIPTVKATFA